MRDSSLDFRTQANEALAVASLVLVAPFAVNNFVQGRMVMGLGSLAVVGVLTLTAWAVRRGWSARWVTPMALCPAILFFLVLCFERQGDIAVFWCYPAVALCYFLLTETQARMANLTYLAVLLPQVWDKLAAPQAARATATLIAVSVLSAIFIRIITEQQDRLRELAVKDPLTGVLNRVLLETSLERAVSQGRRSGTPMSLISLDIDHFKAINDLHGHDAGDRVLRSVGEAVAARLRATDQVFRVGGEEFLVLLFDTDLRGARQVAEDLRRRLAGLPLLPERPVTLSLGVATLEPGEQWTDWVKRSDVNLYVAKSTGRNRLVAQASWGSRV